MQLWSLLLISILLLPLSASDAHAGSLGYLFYTKPRQWVGASYQFQGAQHSVSSRRHLAQEDYNFSSNYAVLKPNFLSGAAAVSLVAAQQWYSSEGSTSDADNLHVTYSISGAFFGRSPVSPGFSLSSAVSQVSNSFARSYQIKSDSYGAYLSLKNKLLPVMLRYRTGTSATYGKEVDTKNTLDQVSFNATHSRGISSSSLDVSRTQNAYLPEQGAGTNERHAQFKLGNDLRWERGELVRNLSSRLDISDASGINAGRNLTLSESLSWDLGRSLFSGANYGYSRSGEGAALQNSNAGGLYLSHSLGKSLSTRLSANMRRDDLPTGYSQSARGLFSLNYTKRLPRESNLTLNGFQEYGWEDRSIGSGLRHVQKEEHSVTFGGRIFLGETNVVGPLTVQNADLLKRVSPYEENVHYRVETVGIQTEVVPVAGVADGIADGDLLQISYDYQVDSSVKISRDAQGAGASLALFQGRYQLSGSFSQSHQEPLSGRFSVATETSQRNARAAFERKWESTRFRTEYENLSSDFENRQSVSATGTYGVSSARSTLSLTVSDRYQWYGETSTGNIPMDRVPENYINASLNYSRNRFYGGSLRFFADYINIRGASRSDRVMLNADLEWILGDMNLSINSAFGVVRVEDSASTSERLNIRLIRYF